MMLKASYALLLTSFFLPTAAQYGYSNPWGASNPPTEWPTQRPTNLPTNPPTHSPTKWPTHPPTNPPTEPPTGAQVVDQVDQVNEDEEGKEATGVDCSQFQASHTFDAIPISMNYVVTVDDESPNKGLFSAQVIFEGVGWVALGFSDEGFMVPSLAVIGLPDNDVSESNPGKYDLTSRSAAGVTLAGSQTILNGNIEQNETHTVLTFQKFLEEEGESQAIDPEGPNFFLVAAGSSNTLGYHAHRASVGLNLVPCIDGTDPSSIQQQPAAVTVEMDLKQGLFKSHGIMAALAWGILAPLAIANSLCRHLIPKTGFWFMMHRGLNVMVLVFTLIAFGFAYSAIDQLNGTHFKSGEGALQKHKTVGLVVVVLTVLQAAGGILRPHLPQKDDHGKEIEDKSSIRTMWEVIHKFSGYSILAMAWYQCHSGLKLYALRFSQDNDFVGVFWVIAGTIAAMAVGGKLHGMFVYKDTTEKSASDLSNSEPTENATENARQAYEVDA